MVWIVAGALIAWLVLGFITVLLSNYVEGLTGRGQSKEDLHYLILLWPIALFGLFPIDLLSYYQEKNPGKKSWGTRLYEKGQAKRAKDLSKE